MTKELAYNRVHLEESDPKPLQSRDTSGAGMIEKT